MELNEQQILEKLFWPENKNTLTGNMTYAMTNEDFTSTVEISVSRTNEALEVFYGTSAVFNPSKKELFVQMVFERSGDNLVLNKSKTSPELGTEKDVLDTFDSISDKVLVMKASNIKPQFFSTGVINTPGKHLTI